MPTKPVRRDLLGHHPEGFRHRGHAAGRGLGQLEPVVVLAGPHLHKLSDEGPAPAVKAVHHGALHAVFFKLASHSITSSARARSQSGTVRPSAVAVFRLTEKRKRVGCSNGKSAGFAPLRMRSTRAATRSKLSS